MLWPHTDECDRTAKRAEGDKSHRTNTLEQFNTKAVGRGFPGGAVVWNPPANAGDMGSSPGPGGSHMPRSN